MRLSGLVRVDVWLMRTCPSIGSRLWRIAEVYWGLTLLLLRLTTIGSTICISWSAIRLIVVSTIVVRMTPLTSSWLRHIRDNLHAARYDTCRSTTAGRVGRSCRTPESLCQLFHQGLTDVVGRDMNCIGDAENDERPFCRKWKT